MKKSLVFAVLAMVLVLFSGIACTQEGDKKITINYPNACCNTPKEDKVTFTLADNSPSGEIPPGYRVLAVFTVNAKEATELYGLDVEVADNYSDYYYWFVDEVKITDQNGNPIYEANYFYGNFSFWGVYRVPAGESKLVVMGHIIFGEQYDSPWNPRPEFQVRINKVYAEKDVEPEAGLAGNTLIPKYTGINAVQTSLANDSPSGILFEGFSYNLYKFHMWADKGDFIFSNATFEVTKFDGDLPYCSLWEGNTLISDQSATYNDGSGKYVVFDENAESQKLLISTTPRTFSLWCQVETNADHQMVQARFAGGFFQPGPSGLFTYINGGPWSLGFDFIKMDELAVSLAFDTPQTIAPGHNVTLMKFKMVTSANEAKLYSLPFTFLNRPAESFSNCHIEDELHQVISVDVSGYSWDEKYVSETYFFGPSDGVYPGDSYRFTVVNTTPRTFLLVCDVAANSELATTIQLEDVYYYQTYSTYYFDIKPDTYPLVETWILQP